MEPDCVLKLSLFLLMKKMSWIKYSWRYVLVLIAYLKSLNIPGYLNNSVEKLSALIVAPREFVLKTYICLRNEALRADMLLLKTSKFYGLQNSWGEQNSQRLMHSKELGICWSFKHVIVIDLVLQSTPTHVMAGPGYSAIAPVFFLTLKNLEFSRMTLKLTSCLLTRIN